jgi:hypothetical protein
MSHCDTTYQELASEVSSSPLDSGLSFSVVMGRVPHGAGECPCMAGALPVVGVKERKWVYAVVMRLWINDRILDWGPSLTYHDSRPMLPPHFSGTPLTHQTHFFRSLTCWVEKVWVNL